MLKHENARLKAEVERLKGLLDADPSTMRKNIQSMWRNIEKFVVLLQDVSQLLRVLATEDVRVSDMIKHIDEVLGR